MNIALFDFDGTITSRDTFADFIYFALDSPRLFTGAVRLAPLIAGYKLGMVPATVMRQSIVKVAFRGGREDELRRIGASYAREILPGVVRGHALDRISWHKAQGDLVVIVSASLGIYLDSWCNGCRVEVISSELEAIDGTLTGRYRGGDCSGDEKRKRVLERYDIQRYETVYAYGDTPEDEPMLGLATKKYYRWKERGGGSA